MLGKRVMFDPELHELPEWLSALFVVDQRGKGLLGRMVAAYGPVNAGMIGTGAPAPDVEGAFRSSSGCRFHTTVDLVWGDNQCKLTWEPSRMLACVTESGV